MVGEYIIIKVWARSLFTLSPAKLMKNDCEAPLNYWQQQVWLYQNTIQEIEEAGQPVPNQTRHKLALAKGALKCWKKTAMEAA